MMGGFSMSRRKIVTGVGIVALAMVWHAFRRSLNSASELARILSRTVASGGGMIIEDVLP